MARFELVDLLPTLVDPTAHAARGLADADVMSEHWPELLKWRHGEPEGTVYTLPHQVEQKTKILEG